MNRQQCIKINIAILLSIILLYLITYDYLPNTIYYSKGGRSGGGVGSIYKNKKIVSSIVTVSIFLLYSVLAKEQQKIYYATVFNIFIMFTNVYTVIKNIL